MIGLVYVFPALGLYIALVLLPLAQAVRLSLYSWDGVGTPKWVGLANYGLAVTDPLIRAAFLHAALLVVFYTVIPMLIGLLVATSLTRVRVYGRTWLRAIYFYPQMVAAVVIGVSWGWVLAPDGPVNRVLGLLGVPASFQRGWLGDFSWALPSIGVIGSWATFGLCMLLFIGGIQRIPISLYQAARVDGAGWWHELWFVTIPSLRTEITIVLVLTLIGAIRVFGTVFVTTQGGPGTATMVPSLLVYFEVFSYNQVGAGAALAVLMTLIISVLIVVVGLIRRERT